MTRGDGGDDSLVEAVRAGDDRAFEVLHARYHRRVTAYAFGMVRDRERAQDITQEVFISAVRRIRQTERPINFRPWVYEIARNACIDHHRRARRAEEVSFDTGPALAPTDRARLISTRPSPDAALSAKQDLDDLRGAFGALSASHHEILVLRELEGLSYSEIGLRMGLSRPAVESTLFRARRRLSEEYDDLATGRRCLRVQAIISASAETELGLRDRRRLGRHLSHCQACRRHAGAVGVAPPAVSGVGARLSALLPFPALLRRGRGDAGAGSATVTAGGHGSTLLAPLSSLGAAMEPLAGTWAKAAATVGAVAFAGAGAGVATQSGLLPGDRLGDLPIVRGIAAAVGAGGSQRDRDAGAGRANGAASPSRVSGGPGAAPAGAARPHGGGDPGATPGTGPATGGRLPVPSEPAASLPSETGPPAPSMPSRPQVTATSLPAGSAPDAPSVPSAPAPPNPSVSPPAVSAPPRPTASPPSPPAPPSVSPPSPTAAGVPSPS